MDGNEVLRRFHARHTGAASAVFAACGSYERLVASVRSGPVLELGCGDGPVLALLVARGLETTGIDMSPEEVALARERVGAPATVHVAMADRLPLADASQAEVVSHMAFMLMTPVEDVVREIARVLRPGGRFTATVGTAGGIGPAARILFALFGEAMKDAPEFPALGDDRVGDAAKLRHLFAPPVWTSFAFEDFGADVSVPAAEIARWFERAFYPVEALPPDAKARLFAAVERERNRLAPDGAMTWTFGMRQFTAVRG